MKDFAMFWGCTIPARFPFIEKSARMVLEGMNLPYKDVDGFTCCPEKSLVNNIDHDVWVATAARNMAVTDSLDINLVSPCTGCISNLSTVKGELHVDQYKKDEVNELLGEVGREFTGSTDLSHLVPFMHDKVGKQAIRNVVKRPLTGMKVLVHYGCHMMRPNHALKADDPVSPQKFDNLVRELGATPLDVRTKLMCCGQGLDRVDQHDNSLHMARLKIKDVMAAGADAIVVCCPSCFLQFDNNQFLMAREGEKLHMPVLYLTELMGLAMGFTAEELSLSAHRVDTSPFTDKLESLNAPIVPAEPINEELDDASALGL